MISVSTIFSSAFGDTDILRIFLYVSYITDPMSITLRPVRISDAKRFYEILNNPNFTYFGNKPASVESEEEYIRKNQEKAKKNIEHSYAIIKDGNVIGGCGIKIDTHRPHIGEIGYFVDEAYWGRGIATKAVRILERIGFTRHNLMRITVVMHPDNKASEKVAIKAGYTKEGTMKKAIRSGTDLWDAHIYAKTRATGPEKPRASRKACRSSNSARSLSQQ